MDAKKKTRRARERDAEQRAAWRAKTRGIEPGRFVWIDETGSHVGMTRTHSRSPRGERAYATVPGRRGKNRTLITALTLAGMGPGLLLDRPIDRRAFEAYIVDRLAPTLTAGQIVVVDNLKVHDSDVARAAIEARGASFWFLPPYSPDFTPIEEAFSKLKASLRTAAPLTTDEHSSAVWAALRSITPADAAGWFSHAGYLAAPPRRLPSPPPRPRPIVFPDAPPVITLRLPSGVHLDHLW